MGDIWYDRGPLLSHSEAMVYIAMGARGTGKTYNFKKWACTKETETVWVRRTKEDIDSLTRDNCRTFLSDLISTGAITDEEGDDVNEWMYKDGILYHWGTPKIYFIALSTSRRNKSQSYQNVTEIVFDEFLEKDASNYLKGEVDKLYELIETVNRLRIDGRKEVRVIMLANKISFVNPYFVHWHILPFAQRFKSFEDGLVIVENYHNEEFSEIKKKTKFGRLAMRSDYGAYAIENEVWDDDDALIEPRDPNSKLVCNLHIQGTYLGVWGTEQYVYITEEYNPQLMTFGVKYACESDEYPLMKSKFPLKPIMEMYSMNRVRFGNTVAKELIFALMQSETVRV